MAIKELKFTRETNFTGRNGFMRCSGIEVMGLDHKSMVQIAPITSKGRVGRCDIEVPVEDVPALIGALQEVIARSDANQIELLKKAEGGDKEAANRLAAMYSDIPHENHCYKRQHGAAECDCIKDDIAVACNNLGIEVG